MGCKVEPFSSQCAIMLIGIINRPATSGLFRKNVRTLGAAIAWCMVLITSLATVFAVDSISIVVRGRWVLMQDGQPAPSDDFQRGLQTSGLAWDGKVLWSV